MGCSKGTVIDFVKIIDANFHNAFNCKSNEEKMLIVNTWFAILSKYPEDVCKQAFINVVEKSSFAPKVADISAECKRILNVKNPSEEELWDIFATALKKADFPIYLLHTSEREKAQEDIEKIFNALPKEIKDYCHSSREFVRIQQDEERVFLKQKFLSRLPLIKDEMEFKENLPEQILLTVENLGERLRLNERN